MIRYKLCYTTSTGDEVVKMLSGADCAREIKRLFSRRIECTAYDADDNPIGGAGPIDGQWYWSYHESIERQL